MLQIFLKTSLSPRKVCKGKNFEVQIFVLQYVLNNSESVLEKKSENFRKFFDFLAIFDLKCLFRPFLVETNFHLKNSFPSS